MNTETLVIANGAKLRRVNQDAVVAALRREAPLSCSDLARRFGVPPASIARVVQPLIKIGILTGSKLVRSGGVGKPPNLIDINPRFASVIGVEIGSVTTRVCLADFRRGVLVAQETPTAGLVGGKAVGLSKFLCAFRDRHLSDFSVGPLTGVAVGVCGLVSGNQGKVIGGVLPKGLDLGGALGNVFGVPLLIGNDANLAALAEHRFGAGRDAKHMVCVLDRGWVGAGLVLNGEIYWGSNDRAGELSSGIVNGGSADSGLSGFPFVESMGLERRIRKTGYRKISPDNFSTRADMIGALTARARDNDKSALSLVQDAAHGFAVALVRLTMLFDPEILVLGGDFTATGKFGEKMVRKFFKLEWRNKWRIRAMVPPRVAFGHLGREAVTLGAVALMIEQITQEAIHGE